MQQRCSPAFSRPLRIDAATMANVECERSERSMVPCCTSCTRGEATVSRSSPPGGPDGMSEENITRVSLKDALKMKCETEWERVRALTDEDIERAVAEDSGQSFWTAEDWKNARVVFPPGKEPVPLRLDRDILAWFKQR